MSHCVYVNHHPPLCTVLHRDPGLSASPHIRARLQRASLHRYSLYTLIFLSIAGPSVAILQLSTLTVTPFAPALCIHRTAENPHNPSTRLYSSIRFLDRPQCKSPRPSIHAAGNNASSQLTHPNLSCHIHDFYVAMDFSTNAFRPKKPSSTLSTDTMGHAQAVEACRWGWSVDPQVTGTSTPHAPAPPVQARPPTALNVTRPNRSTPCRGRLYHQLSCSHRIRTDLVEDCGSNCLEPQGLVSDVPFFCQECVEQEAKIIWAAREAEHNAAYPPLTEMTKEQSDIWYDEHRKLEASFTRDRKIYEIELRSTTRPSNVCSALQYSEEEKAFAAELDSLSLALMSSHTSTNTESQSPARKRIGLPNDASEQIHWSLNSLAIDRGSCGPEFTAAQPSNRISPMQTLSEEELWRRPRERK